MNLKAVLAATQRFVIGKSPALLTGLGVAGVVTTGILGAKAGYSAALSISEKNAAWERGDAEAPTRKETVELVWKEFVPPVVVGLATVTAIIAANRVGTRRAAALAAAFKISENLAEEYREKVIETIGKKPEEEIRSKLAQTRMENTPAAETIIITGSNALFFDELSGRYFQSSMENVRQAVNQINHQINNNFSATLTEFYDLLGLPKSEFSDGMGWNSDELLDVYFHAVMDGDYRSAIGMRYNLSPASYFNRAG